MVAIPRSTTPGCPSSEEFLEFLNLKEWGKGLSHFAEILELGTPVKRESKRTHVAFDSRFIGVSRRRGNWEPL